MYSIRPECVYTFGGGGRIQTFVCGGGGGGGGVRRYRQSGGGVDTGAEVKGGRTFVGEE